MADELLSNLAHLYRRAGFGAPLDRLRQLVPAGFDAAVEALLARTANDPRADFNSSCAISVQDIFDYLAAYFPGCP